MSFFVLFKEIVMKVILHGRNQIEQFLIRSAQIFIGENLNRKPARGNSKT